ncbi:TerC/Alx family metal homeostasis membrane protein [Pseudoclavibacter soli]|uniref:TerC/Alx family metal homeostasis membrane protein n=1 Tax=Pseudoclavibacter soli TaxID=452623 RepID=UPI0004006127|nr:TerC/Alx family metal homeostasis membrane protein [Pseudoclavibacter soli]
MQPLPVAFEIGATIIMLIILIADLLLVVKRPHVPSMRESSLWVGFYVLLALIFAGTLFVIGDAQHGSEFLTGWLTEYSLSIDNLFVFVIIMARFQVPKKYQQEVLMVGIVVALVLRGIFILLGAQIIERWSAVFYLFGAYLVYTAIKQAFGKEDDSEGQNDNLMIRLLRRRVHLTDEFDGSKLRTTIDGQRYWTPMLIVFLAIGTTDLLFAFDSIPAIFGITQNAFLVFATNVFALMGLRQLYFLLGGLLEKLEYLKYGIAFILGFIGVKLVFHAMHVNELPFINGGQNIEWAPEISTVTSLIVILASMGVATVASLLKVRADDKADPEHRSRPGAREI